MKLSIVFLIFMMTNSLEATPPRIKRRLYTIGHGYGALAMAPTYTYGHSMSPYIQSPSPYIQAAPMFQAASYPAHMIQAAPMMHTAPMLQAAPMMQTASMIQGAPMMQPSHMIQPSPFTKYIAVPKYFRIPLTYTSKYVDPWTSGQRMYAPKYHHNGIRLWQ
ncbi:uncharacterized protein LOC143918078 [Arctopsyche grandis]|uniref:uncharacterized protein LOC143918078 n=1 Tax=Arctopsyche grandis TaxID=121162 RepID=UPI00406D765A